MARQRASRVLVQRPDPADLRDPGLRELEIDSLIGVPLLAEGAVIGVLRCARSPPRRFTADDLGMLRLAADRVALAIDHARVYEREHRIAETLQRSLLPASAAGPAGHGGGRPLPARGRRGRGGRRLVRRDPDPRRRRRAW